MSLTDDVKGTLILYVYRNWPVWRVMSAKTKKFSSQIDKVSGDDVIRDVDDFQHRYGAGDYTLRLNDQVVLKKTIAMCTITGLRDLENHPPVIHNLEGLVVDDPQNRDYVGFLRLKGVRVPGVDPLADNREDEDMAGNEALASVLEANKELTDRVLDMADREPNEPTKVDPGVTGAAMGMEIVKQGAEMANAMLSSAMTRAAELASKTEDPTAMVKNLVDIAKSMAPEKTVDGPDPMVLALLEESKQLRTQLFDTQKMQMDMLRQDLAAARVAGMGQGNPQLQAPLQPGGVATFQPQMLDGVDKLLDIVGRLRKSFGGGGGDDEGMEHVKEAPTNMWATILPMAIPAVTGMFAMISNIVYNYAASKMGNQPATPPPPPQVAYSPEQLAEMAAGQEVTGQGMGQGMGAPQTQDQAQGGNVFERLLMELKDPLLKALENGDTGDVFADRLIGWKGRMAYDVLKELGGDTIVQLLRAYPPIWNVVGRVPQKLSKFLVEFLSYDEIVARQEQEDEQGGKEEMEEPTPTPVPTPVFKPVVMPATPPTPRKVARVKTINVEPNATMVETVEPSTPLDAA
jgi:hypothetical protein